MKKVMNKNLAVITGCDSGIGESLCRLFINKGYFVAASYLVKPPFKDDNFFTIKCDLRNEKEINKLIKFIEDLCKKEYKIASLINNAGVALLGPIENLPLKTYRESFEINYFSIVNITQKLIPYLIKSKGSIILIGSLAGRIAAPFSAPYTSTKFALEGYAEVLRREMNPYGIKTVIIEPAAVATPIWNKIGDADISSFNNKYKETINKIRENIVNDGNKGLSSEKAAEIIYNIALKKRPLPRYLISKNTLLEHIKIAIPNSLLDKIMIKLFKLDYGNK